MLGPARFSRSKTVSGLVLGLSLTMLAARARADGPPLPPPSSKLDLLAPGGATSSGMLRFDWAATSFGVERSHFVNSMGFGVSFTPWTPRVPEGMRFLNVSGMLYVGDYGDTRHGPIAGQFSYNPEFRVFNASSVVSVYVGAPFAWTFSPVRDEARIGHIFSAGAATGVELINGGIGVEASFAMAFAPGDVFRPLDATGGKIWEPRGQLSISTNICGFLGSGGFCQHAPLRASQVDLTEALRAFVRASLDHGDVPHPAVCASVDVASSVRSDDTTDPKCELTDPADQFFCRWTKATAGTPDGEAVAKANHLHDALDTCYRQFQADARAASSADRSMRLAEQYLVDPSEVRRVLQCEDGADPYVRNCQQLKLICGACPSVRELAPELCQSK